MKDLPKMRINSLITGAFWTVLGGGISRVSFLFSSILIARLLGKETYGEYGFLKSTILMFVVFGGDAIGLTAAKFVSQYIAKGLLKEATRIIRFSLYISLIIGLVLGFLIVFFAEFLSYYVSNDFNLVKELRISGLIVIISSLNGSFQGVLTGRKFFKELAVINIWSAFFSLSSQVIGAYFFGLVGAIAGYGIGLFFTLVLFVNSSRKVDGYNCFIFKLKEFVPLKDVFFKFSLPAAINGILIVPVIWIGNTFLIKASGPGEMGIFSAALNWRNLVLMIPALVSQVSLPYLSGFHSVKNSKEYYKILKFNILLNFLVSALLVLLISLFSGYIMQFYGAGFISGKNVLIVLLFSSILSSVNSVVGQALNSQGKIWIGVFFNLTWAFFFLVFTRFFLSLGYSSMALALSYLFSYLIHTLIQGVYVFRFRKW